MQDYMKIKNFEEYTKKINDYETQLKIICSNVRPYNVLIVSGDPGIGKSYRAEQILKTQTNVKFTKVEGSSVSPVQLYSLMWQHNDEIIVLDDVNSILQDGKDGASLLKACTESKPVRLLQWQKRNPNCIPVSKFKCDNNIKIAERMNDIVKNSERKHLIKAHDAGMTFPDMFYFTGAIIILTNKSLKSFDRVTEGAVSNRGCHMQIAFSVEGAVDFIKKFGPTLKTYGDAVYTDATLKDTIAFMTSPKAVKYYVENYKIPTIRNLGKIAGQYQLGVALDESVLENNTEVQYNAF